MADIMLKEIDLIIGIFFSDKIIIIIAGTSKTIFIWKVLNKVKDKELFVKVSGFFNEKNK